MEISTGSLITVAFYFIYISCFPSLNVGTSLQDVQSLRNFLFTNMTYDTKIRPVYNQSNVLTLNISVTFISLSKLDVTSGRVEIYGYVTVTWQDQILQWNPDGYGGKDHLDMSLSDIWVPDLMQVIGSSNDNMFESTPVLKLHHDGTVMWISFGTLYGICDQRMEYFPYDKQTCYVDIISARYDSSELSLGVSRRSILMVNPDNGQWSWIDGHAEVMHYMAPGKYGSVMFNTLRNNFSFQRKPEFIMIHIAVPYSILLFLNLFVYLTPLKSGERISFAVTLLLAFAFYSTYISEKVPENSNSISIISIYSAITLAMCTFTVGSSIVLCKLLDDLERDVPRWLQYLSHHIVKVRLKGGEHDSGRSENDAETDNSDTTQQIGDKDEVNAIEESKGTHVTRTKHVKMNVEITWAVAANALDRICFVFNCITLFVSWIVAITIYYSYL